MKNIIKSILFLALLFSMGCGGAQKETPETSAPETEESKGSFGWEDLLPEDILDKVQEGVSDLINGGLNGLLPGGDSDAMEKLDAALKARANEVILYRTDWDEEDGSWEDIFVLIEDRMNEVPEHYWVDYGNSRTFYYGSKEDVTSVRMELVYFEELDNAQTKRAIERAAEQILNQVPEGATDWEAALVIHDALIRRVTYEINEYDQTLYGALVQGRAVCNGFAMAYEYLLGRLGIPCDTVIGYAQDEEASGGDYTRHAWNIVTLTAEDGTQKSAYVDLTWDNTDQRDAAGVEYVQHNWFCLSQEQMDAAGRNGVEDIYRLEQWDLTSEALNYYVVKDCLVEEYDLSAIVQDLIAQRDAGKNVLTVRWMEREKFETDRKALTQNGFQTVMKELGIRRINYDFSNTNQQEGNYCLNIYLNWPEKSQ